MNDLIEALKILKNLLEDPGCKFPTACEHDILYVCGVDLNKVTVDDVRTLATLGFTPGTDDDYSYLPDECKEYGFEWENISPELWEKVKEIITNCFSSFTFGSC